MASRQVVDAVAPQPPAYGLLAAVRNLVSTDPGLMAGIVWPSPECAAASGRGPIDCLGNTESRTPPENADEQTADPFAIWASYRCSPFGWQSIDYVGRAERQLASTQSFQIADELWSGELALDAGSDTSFLTKSTSDTVTSAAAAPLNALACLEQSLAQCGQGRRGLIHATPQVLVHWVTNSSVVKVGGQYVTPLGNIVIADAGYDGSGPGGVAAGASQWAYATDLLQVRLGPVLTIPDNLETAEEWAAALRRTDNTVDVFTQRAVVYQWDACCHLAAEIDLPVCAIGGVS